MRGAGVVVAVVVGFLSVAACTSSSSDGGSGETESSSVAQASTVPGPLTGIAVPHSTAEAVAAVEAEVGRPFDLVRFFARWDETLSETDLPLLIDSGHRIHLSVRPKTNGGEIIAWADLADGTASMDRWIDQMVALPAGSYVTINHEPETRASDANGTAADFVAMWRRFHDELAARDAQHLRLVWTMTGGSFRSGVADDWYPGDDVVDVVGVDSYNWYTCQGTQRNWVDLEAMLDAPAAFARSHAKPLAIPEVAGVEDPAMPGRKAEWLRNAAQTLTTPPLRDELEFVAWFDVTAPGGAYPDCVWDHDSSPETAVAFAEFVSLVADG